MEDHEFPLDSDPNLRKFVKLEMEHKTAVLKMSEMKERFGSVARRSLLSLVAGIALYRLLNQELSFVGVAAYIAGFSVFCNFKTIYNIASSWREMMLARRDLHSWSAVKADYDRQIKGQDGVEQD
jgi:hypothetical protein